MSSLGARLRHARKVLRKMTQPQLAELARIKQPSISELETGETKEISGPTLIAIANALKIRPEWLVTGKGPIEASEMETLVADEHELVEHYRKASSRWKISIMYMAKLRRNEQQEEASSYLLSKIMATPGVSDERVEATLQDSRHGYPPGVHEERPRYGQDRIAKREPSKKRS